MCIALLTTTHPEYPLILIDNRDEFLGRPTARADWWDPPNSHVLGGRDLRSDAHGTWFGLTRDGRIAVLTNFREEGSEKNEPAQSRGAIVNMWLTAPSNDDATRSTSGFAKSIVEEKGVQGVGGFSLLYGHVKDVVNCVANSDLKQEGSDSCNRAESFTPPKGLAIISNRTPDADSVVWLANSAGETHGLSNSHFGDDTWPKVVHGKEAIQAAIDAHVAAGSAEGKQELIARLFAVLSIDTLPRPGKDENFEIYLRQLRKSIFIPPIGGSETAHTKGADEVAAARGQTPVQTSITTGVYGTQKQTVVLVDKAGNATFVERTLFGVGGEPVAEDDRDRVFQFKLDGWTQ